MFAKSIAASLCTYSRRCTVSVAATSATVFSSLISNSTNVVEIMPSSPSVLFWISNVPKRVWKCSRLKVNIELEM